MSSKIQPHVTRLVGMRGLLVNNYMSLRSAVLAGETVIIITENMDLDNARRIAREEFDALNELDM